MSGSKVTALALATFVLSATALHAQTTYYVSPTGNDTINPGTLQAPFRTVQRGVDALQAPGDVLVLRGGEYVGAVLIADKHGTASRPVVIRSYPGERAKIDGYLPLTTPGPTPPSLWEPASVYDADAHPDEFVSRRTFADASVNRGAFLQKGAPYTRLVAYSRLEDLRALNETFEVIHDANDPRPGAPVMIACSATDPNPACQVYPDCTPWPACEPEPNRYRPAGYRLPWVYMGPGLWFNETTGKVHVRLSHTHNAVPGLPDYQGATDPRDIELAVTGRYVETLEITRSSHLLITDVDVRFGGDQTMWLKDVQDLTFDHVNVWAGTRGVRTSAATRTIIRHSSFDGGVPGWMFRSDIKDVHYFLTAGRVEFDGLASQTADAFLSSDGGDAGTLVEYSEFVNGHDLYLAGSDERFHHNWIRNLNDDCLFLDAPRFAVSNAHVYQNVIEQCLSAVNMAGEDVGGPKYVYRNLIDLRLPTAGFRPRNAINRNVWRDGHPFKFRREDGVLAVFQNTFLVNPQHTPEDSLQATFLHYRDTPLGGASRRSFNNIFFVNANVGSDVAITYLPDPGFAGPTDGNDYFRLGNASAKPFRIAAYCFPGPCPPSQPPTFLARSFANLGELHQSVYFQQSKGIYAPGFEANGTEADPSFESLAPDGSPSATDDLRLSAWSHLRNAGILLPKDLLKLDQLVVPPGPRDIGCCPYGSAPLEVGVDGRRRFPNQGSGSASTK